MSGTPTRSFKLTLAYDGAAYVGWQRQPNGPSIQATIESALEPLAGGVAVPVVGAGRTDAGVHALGQVASVRLPTTIDAETLGRALNATLPTDLRVVASTEVPSTFHARFDATAKRYRYRLLHGPVVSPFEQRYAWPVGAELDWAQLEALAQPLVGSRDFAAFQAAGSDVHSTVRELFTITVRHGPPGELASHPSAGVTTVDVHGSGFLRHMVRIIVGTLVDVALGRLPPTAIEDALERGERDLAGRTAPPQGLFLMRVDYGSGA